MTPETNPSLPATPNPHDDGGPAFPMPANWESYSVPEAGMSMLDYFAAKALTAFLSDKDFTPSIVESDVVEDAAGSYVRYEPTSGTPYFYSVEKSSMEDHKTAGGKSYRVVTTERFRLCRQAYMVASEMLKARAAK